MLEVKLLGQFEVLRDGRRLTIPTRNAQSLLSYLVLNAGKAQRRERLAGLLWPDASEDNARSNLRHELWRLRKALETKEDCYFLIDDLTIAFNPQCEHSLDVDKLEDISLEESNANDLIEALSVYGGDLLPGFYDEWVFMERDRLRAIFEAKMARLLELLLAEGRWGEAMEWGTRWIALGQWPEPAYRALMSAYANTGDMPGVTASLASTASLAMQMDKPVVAALLYGAVEDRLESLSVNLLFTDRVEAGRLVSKLKTSLDEATFTDAFSDGWEMSEEQAIELIEEVFGGEGGKE